MESVSDVGGLPEQPGGREHVTSEQLRGTGLSTLCERWALAARLGGQDLVGGQ